MPAFGLSAVPLPMKNRMKSATGFDVSDAVADAAGENAANGSAGSPLLVAAAAAGAAALLPSSRRLSASAAHASGAIAGDSSVPPG